MRLMLCWDARASGRIDADALDVVTSRWIWRADMSLSSMILG